MKLPLSSSSKQQRGPFLHPRVARGAYSDIILAVVCGTRSCVQPILRLVDDLDHHLVVGVVDVSRGWRFAVEVSMLPRDRRGVRQCGTTAYRVPAESFAAPKASAGTQCRRRGRALPAGASRAVVISAVLGQRAMDLIFAL